MNGMGRWISRFGLLAVCLLAACRDAGGARPASRPPTSRGFEAASVAVVANDEAAPSPFDRILGERRSIRRFRPDPVPDSAIRAIVEAAAKGPSAGNLQAFRIVVVRDRQVRVSLQRAALGQSAVGQAPVVLVFCADGPVSARKYGDRGRDLYAVQDATIAGLLAWLKAVDLGLGAVWIGAFDEDRVSAALDLPPGLRPVAILPIGHPDESPGPKTTRPIEDLRIDR